MTCCLKAAGRQLPLAPIGAAVMLDRHSLTGLHVRDQLVDLHTVKCPLDPQHNRQRHQDIAVRQQQITGCDVAVRDGTVEVLNRNDHHMLDAKDHDGSMSHLGQNWQCSDQAKDFCSAAKSRRSVAIGLSGRQVTAVKMKNRKQVTQRSFHSSSLIGSCRSISRAWRRDSASMSLACAWSE